MYKEFLIFFLAVSGNLFSILPGVHGENIMSKAEFDLWRYARICDDNNNMTNDHAVLCRSVHQTATYECKDLILKLQNDEGRMDLFQYKVLGCMVNGQMLACITGHQENSSYYVWGYGTNTYGDSFCYDPVMKQ